MFSTWLTSNHDRFSITWQCDYRTQHVDRLTCHRQGIHFVQPLEFLLKFLHIWTQPLPVLNSTHHQLTRYGFHMNGFRYSTQSPSHRREVTSPGLNGSRQYRCATDGSAHRTTTMSVHHCVARQLKCIYRVVNFGIQPTDKTICQPVDCQQLYHSFSTPNQ